MWRSLALACLLATLPGAAAAGPVVGLAADLTRVAVTNSLRAAEGEDTTLGRDVSRLVRRYTPGANVWYWSLAMQRLAFDTLQYRSVKHILAGGHDQLSLPSLAHADAYRAHNHRACARHGKAQPGGESSAGSLGAAGSGTLSLLHAGLEAAQIDGRGQLRIAKVCVIRHVRPPSRRA
jgi:hypothetical protein